jgi:hypothetical protein
LDDPSGKTDLDDLPSYLGDCPIALRGWAKHLADPLAVIEPNNAPNALPLRIGGSVMGAEIQFLMRLLWAVRQILG